jgi:hypothetical protein
MWSVETMPKRKKGTREKEREKKHHNKQRRIQQWSKGVAAHLWLEWAQSTARLLQRLTHTVRQVVKALSPSRSTYVYITQKEQHNLSSKESLTRKMNTKLISLGLKKKKEAKQTVETIAAKCYAAHRKVHINNN